jgi:hypothetical protein
MPWSWSARWVPGGVLISNLSHDITEELLRILKGVPFRTALVTIGEVTDLTVTGQYFAWHEVTRITGDEFVPPQAEVSRVIRLTSGATPSRVPLDPT